MGNRWIIYFLAVPMAFLCGCGDGESSGREECEQQKSEGQVHIEAAPTSAVTNEVAMAVAEIEKDFATIPSVVTNWVDARKAAYCIREKICRLPSELSVSRFESTAMLQITAQKWYTTNSFTVKKIYENSPVSV